MAIAQQLVAGSAKLFIGKDMAKALTLNAGAGVATVYSSRSPGKQTPNEDAAGVFSYGNSECVLAVADGLGGLRAGHQASSLAIEAVKEALDWGLAEGSELRESVLNGFESANRAVQDLGIGAATTLAVVEVQGMSIRPYHVGDSLIVVVGQRGKIKLQSVPHSPVGYGIESGLLDETEAMYHEERHIVSNVIGTPDMRIEVGSTLELAPRDRLLIASDGLWDNLHMEEIIGTVRKGPLRRAVKTLVQQCDARMHEPGKDAPSKPDDLTLVLFRRHSPSRKLGKGQWLMSKQKTVEIDGVKLHLTSPEKEIPVWVGQREVLLQLLAAWARIEDKDLPLHPRLLGKPGVGKTTLACAAAKELGLDVYIAQATMDTRPEDLLVSPVLDPRGGVRYMASPLVTAMLRGGALILDEGNRMSERSWASLAPLLDHRRYVESVVAGIKIQAHEGFRFVTTMNEDASTYEVPEYIHSRLMPQIYIDFPEEDEERAILKDQVPFADEDVLEYVMTFLQAAHAADLRYSVRDGINVVRYAMKSLGTKQDKNAKAAVAKSLQLALGTEEANQFDIF